VIFSSSPANTMLLIRGIPLLLFCLWMLAVTNAALLRFFGLEVQYVEESGLGPVTVQTETRWLDSTRLILQVGEDESVEEALVVQLHNRLWTYTADVNLLLDLLVSTVAYTF
jgi:hypothetical protein